MTPSRRPRECRTPPFAALNAALNIDRSKSRTITGASRWNINSRVEPEHQPNNADGDQAERVGYRRRDLPGEGGR